MSRVCRLCGSGGPHQQIQAREMMFGSREPFAYYSCRACDSLQIVDVPGPDDLRRHYPADYYAYDVPSASKPLRWLIAQQDRFELRFGGWVVGRSLAALPPGVRSLLGGSVVRMLGQLAIEPDARILDVGCGNGMLLDRLARVGFSNLSGADPFIAADHKTPFGVSIFKRYLSDVPGKFGLIMFNHSLEHVPDMMETLAAAAERLNPGGICLIRLPTTSCEAWTVYGADWVSVDAPRHTVIPSRVGMMLAADAVGLKVERTFDDSSSYQFFASELNRRDVALAEADSLAEILRYFGPKQIWNWEMRSERLNRQGRGEQTGFVLRAKRA